MSTATEPERAATVATPTTGSQGRQSRYWEVDTLRGVAVVMMIVYHLMWDLWFFQILNDAEFWNPFWKYWQRATASIFIILVGVSLTLVYRREPAPSYKMFLRRGLRVLGLGLIVTLTMVLSGVGVIDFGILHLIGFSVIAAYPLLRFTWLNLGLWLLFFVVGGLTQAIHWEGAWIVTPVLAQNIAPLWVDGRWLVPLGIVPPGYGAVDFFPVFPWFGVVLLGVWLGNVFYTAKGRLFALPAWGELPQAVALGALGRNSLLVYLLHQPVLIAAMYGLGIARF